MKCKLYKGPMHNRLVEVPDYELDKGYVSFVYSDKKSKGLYFGNDVSATIVATRNNVATYQIMIMSGTVAGRKFHGPSVHPDGSLILKYMERKK